MITKLINISKKFPNFVYKVAASSSEIKKFENNFLNTTNLAYIESLYQKWTQDRESVSPSFQTYFQLL